MRLGVLGGSFDPPHVGHLLMASDAFEALRLDLLLFIPAATQPLKAGRSQAAPADRLAMVRLLCQGDDRFAVDSIEIDRDGLSFTVDTLSSLAARYPGSDRYFLAGADVLATFGEWREPERILELAQLAVMRRAGDARRTSEGEDTLDTEALGVYVRPPARAPVTVPTRRVDVSSTEIRARLRGGLPIRGFVPAAVDDYIRSRGLYR